MSAPSVEQVGQAVRGVADAIDDGDGADGSGARGDLGDRVDLADDVGAVRAAIERGPCCRAACRDRRATRRPVSGSTCHSRISTPHLGELAPGAGIGLVVLVGDDDGVAGLQPAGEGIAQHVGVGRGRGAEMDPVGGDVERLGHALEAEVHRLAGFARGRVEAVGLHLGGAVDSGRAGRAPARRCRSRRHFRRRPGPEATARQRRGTRRGCGPGSRGRAVIGGARRAGDRWLAEGDDGGNAACG